MLLPEVVRCSQLENPLGTLNLENVKHLDLTIHLWHTLHRQSSCIDLPNVCRLFYVNTDSEEPSQCSSSHLSDHNDELVTLQRSIRVEKSEHFYELE